MKHHTEYEVGTEKHYESIIRFIYDQVRVHTFLLQYYGLDDLVQIASLDYRKACNKFDESKGYSFLTWYGRIIDNRMKMLMRKFNTFNGVRSQTVSLDLHFGDKDNLSIMDFYPDNNTPEKLILDKERIEFVLDMIDNHKHSRVLWLHFVEGITQTRVAKEVGMSQPHVTRVCNKFKVELRKEVNECA